MTIIAAVIVDGDGRVVPTAANPLTFEVTGSARLLGVGNGDPSSHESDLGPTRRAFNGLCMAIVQARDAAGVVRVRAASPGLETGTIEITCKASPSTPSL